MTEMLEKMGEVLERRVEKVGSMSQFRIRSRGGRRWQGSLFSSRWTTGQGEAFIGGAIGLLKARKETPKIP